MTFNLGRYFIITFNSYIFLQTDPDSSQTKNIDFDYSRGRELLDKTFQGDIAMEQQVWRALTSILGNIAGFMREVERKVWVSKKIKIKGIFGS